MEKTENNKIKQKTFNINANQTKNTKPNDNHTQKTKIDSNQSKNIANSTKS